MPVSFNACPRKQGFGPSAKLSHRIFFPHHSARIPPADREKFLCALEKFRAPGSAIADFLRETPHLLLGALIAYFSTFSSMTLDGNASR